MIDWWRTWYPRSRAIVSTESWVMPSRAPASAVFGVKITPLRTMKTFSPVHSLTVPFGASKMASSYPALIASTLASDELTYIPVPLAAVGTALGSWRRHELILHVTPLAMPSSPRYVPHGQAAMDTLVG